MSPTKGELATENRRLRRLVGEVYDRVADYIEPQPREQEENDIDEEDTDDIDDEGEDDEE